MSNRLPRPDSARIRDTSVQEGDVLRLPAGTQLVRIHCLAGPHPCTWDRFRAWGPTGSRFDHQTLPRREHPRRRMAYLTRGSTAVPAALAEFFQDEAGGVGPMDLTHRRPSMTIVTISSELTLLDLDSGWVTRAGGNQAITSGPRAVCRDWARAIYRHHTGVHGVAYRSSVWGPGRCVVLWERAERAFPATPAASRDLSDPRMADAVAEAADQVGTIVV